MTKAMEKFLQETGETTAFGIRFFKEGLNPRFEWKELLKQCYINGYK